MKKLLRLIILLIAITTGCNKKEDQPPLITLPVLGTASIDYIGGTTAKAAMDVRDGGSPLISYGVCWGTKTSPTTSDNTSYSNNIVVDSFFGWVFSCTMTGLTETLYYVRYFATNSKGTSYSNEISFRTRPVDSDGNTYGTVTIGTQVWIKENLKTTKYSNGDNIPNVTDRTAWSSQTTGAWSYYNNDIQINAPYGKLYNWYAVTDSRKLCPAGWHIPNETDWTLLTTYLGGEIVAGGKLKVTGTDFWNSPNTAATNESGFSAYPGGYRAYDVDFSKIGIGDYQWSTTEFDANNGWVYGEVNDAGTFFKYNNGVKANGYSVRCLKD